MRLLKLIFIFCCLLAGNSLKAQTSGLPYLEDFEEEDGGWTASGTNFSWERGVPANSFIASAASGKQAWVTSLSGNYNNDELSYLTSPVFDFSGLEDSPVLKFQFIHQLEKEYDGVWLEASVDGGKSWTKLETDLIYNNQARQWWDDVSGSSGDWSQATILLNGLEGKADVRFRFVLSSDGVYPLEGFGLDKIEVLGALTDGKVTEIVNLKKINCGLGQEVFPSVKVANMGNKAFSGFTLCVEANGLTICEEVSQSIAPLAELTYTFTQSIDVSEFKSYYIKAYLQLAEDKVADNDILSLDAINTPLISRFSYLESFETGEGGWGAYGENSSWSYRSSETANAYWANGLSSGYNNSEISYLESPCLDFSEVKVDPKLEFKLKYATEEVFDGLWLEISKDGGISWSKLSNTGAPVNWYNNTEKGWWDGESQPAAEWIKVSAELLEVKGQAEVKIRFAFSSDENVNAGGVAIDDLLISAPLYQNLGDALFTCAPLDTLLDAGNPGAEYLWSTGASSRQIQYSRTEAGTDTLWVDIRNSFGTLRDSLVIVVSSFELADLPDTTVCEGAYVSLMPEITFNGPVAPEFTYFWSINDSLAGMGKKMLDFKPGGGEADTLVFYAESVKTACSLSDTIIIGSLLQPSMHIERKDTVYAGDSIEIYAEGAEGTYEWQIEGGESFHFEGKGPHTVQFTEGGAYTVRLLSESGSCLFESSDSLMVEEVLAIPAETRGLAGLKIYPNPGKGTFFVEYQAIRPQTVSYQLFDLAGKERWEATYSEGTDVLRKIEIKEKLPSGMYVLWMNGKEFHERLLIVVD